MAEDGEGQLVSDSLWMIPALIRCTTVEYEMFGKVDDVILQNEAGDVPNPTTAGAHSPVQEQRCPVPNPRMQ